MIEFTRDFRGDEGLPSPQLTANTSSQWLIFFDYLGILNTTETDIEVISARLAHDILVSTHHEKMTREKATAPQMSSNLPDSPPQHFPCEASCGQPVDCERAECVWQFLGTRCDTLALCKSPPP
jgi:hypothetical protein